MQIHIESPQFKADQELLVFIKRKLSKLDVFFDRIERIDVFLKLESHRKVREKVVEMKLALPGKQIYYSEKARTFEAAVDRGLDKVKRQVKRLKDRRRKK